MRDAETSRMKRSILRTFALQGLLMVVGGVWLAAKQYPSVGSGVMFSFSGAVIGLGCLRLMRQIR